MARSGEKTATMRKGSTCHGSREGDEEEVEDEELAA